MYISCPLLEEDKELSKWIKQFKTQEIKLQKNIEDKLKTGWTFSRILPLEKAIMMYAAKEIEAHKPQSSKPIIDQIINFSKAYLEENKYKYINKVLDLFIKELT